MVGSKLSTVSDGPSGASVTALAAPDLWVSAGPTMDFLWLYTVGQVEDSRA